MVKKCIICDDEAIYTIRGTSDFYCQECAEEHFDDVGALEKVEEKVSKIIEDTVKDTEEQNNEEDADD